MPVGDSSSADCDRRRAVMALLITASCGGKGRFPAGKNTSQPAMFWYVLMVGGIDVAAGGGGGAGGGGVEAAAAVGVGADALPSSFVCSFF